MTGANVGEFPTLASLDGAFPTGWLLTIGLPAAIGAPVVEEFFFRAVVLIAIYQILRRSVGTGAAIATAVLMSAGGFVLLHAVGGVLTLQDGIQLFVVGSTCGLFVVLTGRIWGAVLTHLTYNATYLLLLVVGSVLT
ncbi:CPBP family intramembrane glutamic endopeptidase [Microbacterium testaceum]|nr:CPBP family intramembrane glutamic endopeptidase [Microbacterium testaceum]